MGGLTGYLFPQPIRDSVFSTERGLEYLSKGHNSTRDKREEAWWYWSQGLTHDDPLLNPKEGPKKETFSMTSA